MAMVEPNVMLNSIMGKIYDILTNGDENVPKSEDNFFSWATPGIPLTSEDVRFMTQGLTGVVRKAALEDFQNGGSGESEDSVITPALLDQLRATDAAQLLRQAEDFARLVDFVPEVSGNTNEQLATLAIMNNEGSLSDRYSYILRMSQVMETELPKDVKDKIERFRGLLQVTKMKKNLIDDTETEVTEASPLVTVYNEKMTAYMDAALEYNTRRIDAMSANNQSAVHFWAINANILRNKVKAAMSDWINSGYKNDYESIAAYIDQVMRRDMALLKAQYLDDMEKARLTGLASGSDFFYSTAVPGNFMESTGWSEFSFSSADYNRNTEYTYNLKSPSGGVNVKFLKIFKMGTGGNSSSSTTVSNVSFDSNHFKMTFQIAQIPIIRPWFKEAFITGKTWRMDQNDPEAKNEMVSDGGNPPKGLIPAYPTTMILIRDLDISFAKSEGFNNFFQEWSESTSRTSGLLSLGPITLGGTYNRKSEDVERRTDYHYESSTQRLRVPGTQIIGFKCHLFPKSPDPLPEIQDWI